MGCSDASALDQRLCECCIGKHSVHRNNGTDCGLDGKGIESTHTNISHRVGIRCMFGWMLYDRGCIGKSHSCRSRTNTRSSHRFCVLDESWCSHSGFMCGNCESIHDG